MKQLQPVFLAKVILAACLGSVFFSCQTPQRTWNERVDSVYVQRLIPVVLPADSASLKALLVCNAQGRVMVNQLNFENTQNTRLIFLLDSLGNLEVKTVFMHDTVFLKADSVHVTSTVTEWKYVEKSLSRWDAFILRLGNWMFGALCALIIAIVVYIVLKIRKKIRII